MYRPLKRPPKGAWSRHLQEQRRLRDLSVVEAFELVYERIGWSRKSRTAFAAIDSGERQPKDNEITVLGAEFGWPTGPAEDPPAPDQGALIAALQAQTAAITALADQVKALVEAQPKPTELAHALGEAVALAARGAWQASGRDGAPHNG